MKEKIAKLLENSMQLFGINDAEINIEIPKNKDNGDYSSNVAMKYAKTLNMNPRDLANKITQNITSDFILNIEIAGPGFINFYVKKDYLFENLDNVFNEKENYGSSNFGNGKKINIEFVSANPTGILHMGNARGGAYGDSLARIMTKAGFNVTKEYYMNDAGNQINKLGNSILARYLELKGEEIEFPENGYRGPEIIEIAKELFDKNSNLTAEDLETFKDKGVEFLSKEIFKDLKDFRIEYDKITSERWVYKNHPINNVIEQLKNNGHTYEKDGALWFKSSQLYDTDDHVLIKADGNYTYLVPDIPYHMDKIDRGYDELIDVLGTDHHGYVARLKSGVKAVGYDAEKINVKLLQLVRIVKNGQVASMHKRSGNVITLRDLVNEVGVNAARYFFSRYSLDTQMDFDIELAKSKSNENPVYYVCYAYARICSILKNYDNIDKVNNFNFLENNEAYNVLESIYNFKETIENSAKRREPHIITNYVYELASLFHTYYEKHRIVTDNIEETNQNLYFIKCVQIVLKNALDLIGVIPEERM